MKPTIILILGVTTIDHYAFGGCTGLTKVNITEGARWMVATMPGSPAGAKAVPFLVAVMLASGLPTP